jgi:hypothetical protein
MFPKTAAQFFKTRTAGPKGIGKESSETKTGPEPAPVESASGNARPGESRAYIIRVDGEEHKVTVTPAQ